MENLFEMIGTLLAASPNVLALLLGLAAIFLATFAIYVVHQRTGRGGKD